MLLKTKNVHSRKDPPVENSGTQPGFQTLPLRKQCADDDKNTMNFSKCIFRISTMSTEACQTSWADQPMHKCNRQY